MQIRPMGFFLLAGLGVLASGPGAVAAEQTTLVDNGQARCEIRVPERVMSADQQVPGQPYRAQQVEMNRRRLRQSIEDLALYFEKMSGAKIEIHSDKRALSEKTIPILIGEPAR